MNARLARLALRLYPLAYRRRYGEEMEALVEDEGASAGTVLDLLRGAIGAHLRPEPAVAETVTKDERLRHGLAAVLGCWAVFVVAGLALYKTTEGRPFEGVSGTPGALGGIHLAIQTLAVIGGAAVLVGAIPFGLALLRHAEPPRRALRIGRMCAAVVAAAMIGIAALTAAYLVAITTAAPHLAGEPNGPFGTPDVAVSLALQLVLMVAAAVPATLVALRTRRTAAR